MSSQTIGRPRDAHTHAAILAATRDLLSEIGYNNTSIGAVARRARVGKDAIYRRWSGKPELVYEAVFTVTDSAPVPATGSLLGDLTELADGVLAEFTATPAAAALPGLLADFAADPRLRQRIRSQFLAESKHRVVGVLTSAQRRGDVDDDLDVDLVLDMLAGTVFFHVGLAGATPSSAMAGDIARIISAGICRR